MTRHKERAGPQILLIAGEKRVVGLTMEKVPERTKRKGEGIDALFPSLLGLLDWPRYLSISLQGAIYCCYFLCLYVFPALYVPHLM